MSNNDCLLSCPPFPRNRVNTTDHFCDYLLRVMLHASRFILPLISLHPHASLNTSLMSELIVARSLDLLSLVLYFTCYLSPNKSDLLCILLGMFLCVTLYRHIQHAQPIFISLYVHANAFDRKCVYVRECGNKSAPGLLPRQESQQLNRAIRFVSRDSIS